MEALNFVRHVLGVHEVDCLVNSRRCRGLCTNEVFTESKQAPALTLSQLERLHVVLEEHADAWTRHFAGAALVTCYARCRRSDVQHTDKIVWDADSEGRLAYVELQIGLHKTSRLQSKRHRFMHAVAPAVALRGDYASRWREYRRELGLADPPHMPFCPAPDRSGAPTVRGIESDEATAWLRLILKEDDDSECRVSSKSLKATVISWGAKRGLEPLVLQRLGYHAAGGMDVVYSRDAQAPLLLLVERLIKEIKDGAFRPDETRGGRLDIRRLARLAVPAVGAAVEEVCPEAGVAPADDELEPPAPERANLGPFHGEGGDDDGAKPGSEASERPADSPCCESSSSSSSEDEDDQPMSWVGPRSAVPAGFDLWMHAQSLITHLAPSANFRNLLACGRRVGPQHRKLEGRQLGEAKQCKFCFQLPKGP